MIAYGHIVTEAVTVSGYEDALEQLSKWMEGCKPAKRFWKKVDEKFVLFDRRADGSITPIKIVIVDIV